MSQPSDPAAPRLPFWRRPLDRKTLGAILGVAAVTYLVLPPMGCACATPGTYRDALRSALRRTVAYLARFHADSSRYPGDAAALSPELPHLVLVTVDSITPRGYRVRAAMRDASLPLYQGVGTCVAWAGDSSLAIPTVPEGEPRCWVPRRPLWHFGRYRSPPPVPQ